MPQQKPSLEIIEPVWPSLPSSVKAFTTLRTGGLSSGAFGDINGISGLNVGAYVGDFDACVRMNRRLVSDFAQTPVRWMHQVHGVEVAVAEDIEDEFECDALITTQKGLALAVQTADCVPILIADTEARAIAAVHGGWKSLASGIVEKTLDKLRATFGNDFSYTAWIGPAIDGEHFEVGEDVPETFMSNGIDVTPELRPLASRFTLDLPNLSRRLLAESGINQEKIFMSSLSTFTDPERFYSYRRDTKTGRHATLIWIAL